MLKQLLKGLLTFLLTLLGYFTALFLFFLFFYLMEETPATQEQSVVQTPPKPYKEGMPYAGYITLFQPSGIPLNNVWVPQQYLKKNYKEAGMHTIAIGPLERRYTLIAYDRERNPYFANAFLIDYMPYPVEHKWEPLSALSLRLRYQLDAQHFPGYYDIWLTPKQAYEERRGDCEDHALLLADWLIALGYDARVVVGTYKGGGHAWVVLFEEGKTYLLEATSKFSSKLYPLASQMTDYRPEIMFNRKDLWVNTGTKLTTDYRGKAWERTSSFTRQSP